MLKNKISVSILFLALSVAVSGCSIKFNTGATEAADNGGIFASANKGDSWNAKNLIPTTTGKPKSLGGVNVNVLKFDPSDNKAIYSGSQDNGLFYTYDGGNNWNIAESLGPISIIDVAIDPADKCIIYVAFGNKVVKSKDCSRSWAQVYFDNDDKVTVNAIAIDHYNSNNVYIGLSRGEMLKSSDKGGSWHALKRFDNKVEEILINSADSRIMFAATAEKGVFRTNDAGKSWTDLSVNLKDFKDSNRFRDLAISSKEPNLIILANNYGLIKSLDNGDTWSKIELITPEKEAIINAVALNPKNVDEIYYVTNTTFYRSLDGGKNWATKKLPTSRAGGKLLVDPVDGNLIYLGIKAVKK